MTLTAPQLDLSVDAIEAWLREESPERLEDLWAAADACRREHVGDAVHLRGLAEISNTCVRSCAYCGLRAPNGAVERYRMTREEVLDCARRTVEFGYGTIVMQSGEDYGITREWLADVVRAVKSETPLAVTLSLGERPYEDLVAWREAGADRYLLRLETSDQDLYERIHPSLPGRKSDRIAILGELRELGYEVGSGVMIGIPGQSYRSLAEDVDLFRRLDLDMIGCGPFIPHPDTPLGRGGDDFPMLPPEDQVPATEDVTYKVLALARLVCPEANIPSTTALATLNKDEGRELGLQRGANVVMPNVTPVEYRVLYSIYPDKACLNETAEHCRFCLASRIASIGRTVGQGQGGRGMAREDSGGAEASCGTGGAA